MSHKQLEQWHGRRHTSRAHASEIPIQATAELHSIVVIVIVVVSIFVLLVIVVIIVVFLSPQHSLCAFANVGIVFIMVVVALGTVIFNVVVVVVVVVVIVTSIIAVAVFLELEQVCHGYRRPVDAHKRNPAASRWQRHHLRPGQRIVNPRIDKHLAIPDSEELQERRLLLPPQPLPTLPTLHTHRPTPLPTP